MKGNNLKKILAFGILVVLALASFNVLSLPRVRAQTIEAQVISYSWYTAPSTTFSAEYINDIVAVGEVQNKGSATTGAVLVVGGAYDSNGTLLASSEARAIATNLVPDQKAPFYLDFTPEESVTQDQSWVPNVARVTVSVYTIFNATDTGIQYAGLTTSNLNGVNNAGTYTVTGTIQNAGDQSVGDVAVIATYYNSNGTVVALSLTDLGTGLVQGQSKSFSVTPWDDTSALSSEIASYAIQVQSTPATPIATSKPTAQPTTQPTLFQGSSPTQNPGTSISTEIYEIVIAVVVAVVVVAAVLVLLKMRGKSRKVEAPSSPAQLDPQI